MKVATQLNMLDDAFNSFSKFSLSLRVSFPSTTVSEVVFFSFSLLLLSVFMDHEVIERLQKVKLTSKEGRVIQVRPTEREKILEECLLSLSGRFLTTKQTNLRAAKNLLRNSRKFGANLKIIEVGEGLLQFKFTIDSQLQWVIHNRP